VHAFKLEDCMANDTKYDTISNVGYCAMKMTKCMNTFEHQAICTSI